MNFDAGRVTACLVPLLALLACSPGRIGSDGSDGSESSSAIGSESEDGPSVETGEDDGGDDPGGPGGPGPCNGDGSVKWLDICEPPDPCDLVECDGDACIGGLCVAPMPEAECQGPTLVELALPVDFVASDAAPLFADIDGLPGDELISGNEGIIEVMRADELIVSQVLPLGPVSTIQAFELDADGSPDLLVHSLPSEAWYTRALVGDGHGGFELAPTGISDTVIERPVAIDFDNDGDDDVLGWAPSGQATYLHENSAGLLSLADSFALDGRRGVAVDIDLDGFVDDALLGDYPSPALLRGDAGMLVEEGSLPAGMRGPIYEFGVGRPVVGDLDVDGLVEVLALLVDNRGRVGVRVWWGLPGGQFDDPRDQMLTTDNVWGPTQLVGVHELDGVAPPELLIHVDHDLFYVRAEVASRSPVACAKWLHNALEADVGVGVGDLEGDGQLELAARWSGGLELFTVAPP